MGWKAALERAERSAMWIENLRPLVLDAAHLRQIMGEIAYEPARMEIGDNESFWWHRLQDTRLCWVICGYKRVFRNLSQVAITRNPY